jgi:DNA-binding MarR family transcriptional regulator
LSKHQSISELNAHLGYWLRYVSNHVSHAFRKKIEARGVSVAEWTVLRQLLGRDSLQPNQIAEELGMTRGAISKLAERLVQKGFVERTAAALDRRCQTLALTATGRRLVPVLARLADENDAEYFGHLEMQQQADLMELLRSLVRRHGWRDAPVD